MVLFTKDGYERENKYYLADLSLYFSLNTDNQLNYGPSLENIIYLYLVSHNYQVSVGKTLYCFADKRRYSLIIYDSTVTLKM